MLDSDRASEVLAHLEKYEYASIQHAAIALMWHTMMRVGGVHALDVGDYDSDAQCVKVRHRPKTGTPIKNQGKGERMVALSDQVCDLLDNWLAEKRPSITDEYGREPLLASREGPYEQDDASSVRLPVDLALYLQSRVSARPQPR